MPGGQGGQSIPTQLGLGTFGPFACHVVPWAVAVPHQSGVCLRSSTTTLRPLLIGCHRKELAIERDDEGRPEIHYHALQPLVYRLAEADLPAPAAERLTLDEKHDKAGKPYGIPIFTARPTWLARGASWTGMLA
jgi:hypothetical protein